MVIKLNNDKYITHTFSKPEDNFDKYITYENDDLFYVWERDYSH